VRVRVDVLEPRRRRRAEAPRRRPVRVRVEVLDELVRRAGTTAENCMTASLVADFRRLADCESPVRRP